MVGRIRLELGKLHGRALQGLTLAVSLGQLRIIFFLIFFQQNQRKHGGMRENYASGREASNAGFARNRLAMCCVHWMQDVTSIVLPFLFQEIDIVFRQECFFPEKYIPGIFINLQKSASRIPFPGRRRAFIQIALDNYNKTVRF